MALRVQLISENYGSLTLDQVDPDGLSSLKETIKRSEESAGLFKDFTIPLKYNKEARRLIQAVFEDEGIKGKITFNLYELTGQSRWILIYSGLLAMKNYKLGEYDVSVNVDESGFKRSFQNQTDITIDLESTEAKNGNVLPAAPTEDILFRSKVIVKKTQIGEDDILNQSYLPTTDVRYLRAGTANVLFEEIEDSFVNTDVWTDTKPIEDSNYLIKHKEAGERSVTINWRGSMVVIDPPLDIFTEVVYKVVLTVQGVETDLYTDTIAQGSFTDEGGGKYSYDISFDHSFSDTVNAGDELYIHIEQEVNGASAKYGFEANSGFNIDVVVDTITEDETVKSFMIHEALERVCQSLTGQETCFQSEYFGRIANGYAEDGEGSYLCITSGAAMRGVNDGKIYCSWDDLMQSLRAVYCVGWGFEVDDEGNTIVRVEPIPYFYQDTESVDVGSVAELEKQVFTDMYYSSIKFSYPNLENIKQINAVDEFNTDREYTTGFSEIKNALELVSIYRASGFEIESQRRNKDTTEESKLDEENFMVCVIDDGGGGFQTEQDENIQSITGVQDPETAMNVRISPARNLRRWGRIIAAQFIRETDKVIKFGSGKVNVSMTSQLTGESEVIDESGDYDNQETPVFYPEGYEFKCGMDTDQMVLLRDTPSGYISGLDWNNQPFTGFLLEVDREIDDKKADFRTLRKYL